MKKFLCVTALMLTLGLLAATAQAHEFLIKPVQLSADKGAVVPFSVVSAHVFMVSEEMEPKERVSAALILQGKATPLTLAANPTLMTLDGRITPAAEGTAIIAGHREGMIWTQTTSGWKQQSKKGLTGVVGSGKYEKFCKTLLTVGHPDGSATKPLGQRLEIVPQTDPTQAKAGDELVVQVLFEGKPLNVENVLATYDGFTGAPNSFAYFTEPYGQGMARVKLSEPGLWMVRVQHALNESTEDYDKLVIRSSLVFEVK